MAIALEEERAGMRGFHGRRQHLYLVQLVFAFRVKVEMVFLRRRLERRAPFRLLVQQIAGADILPAPHHLH